MRMVITAAVLTFTASCDRSPRPFEHAHSDFTTTVEGQEVVLTYEGTHDVIQDEDPDIRLLVLVHHDGRLNSVGSFNYVMAALGSAAVDRPEYLGHFFGPDVYDSKFIDLVPEVGHDGSGMYTSDQGKAIIFIDADSAAAALRDRSDLGE